MLNLEDPEYIIRRKLAQEYNIGKSQIQKAVRAAQGKQQAVIKITSFGKGHGKTKSHIDYIARDGDLELKGADGSSYSLDEVQKEIKDNWFKNKSRKNSRDTVNMVLSAPRGSDVNATEAAVRDFASNTFEDKAYFYAIHDDTEHPHAHIVIRNNDGKKLRHDKNVLKAWRSEFAKSLRDHGIDVDASSRIERGQFRRSISQKLYHVRKRKDKAADTDIKRYKEAVSDYKKGNHEQPWKATLNEYREAAVSYYKEVAENIRETGIKGADKMAGLLDNYAKNFPQVETDRDKFIKDYESKIVVDKSSNRRSKSNEQER